MTMINLIGLNQKGFIVVKRNIVKVRPGFVDNQTGSIIYFSDGSYQHVLNSLDDIKAAVPVFIQLTDKQTGLPMLLNPEHIIKIERQFLNKNTTVIFMTTKTVEVVKETIENFVIRS